MLQVRRDPDRRHINLRIREHDLVDDEFGFLAVDVALLEPNAKFMARCLARRIWFGTLGTSCASCNKIRGRVFSNGSGQLRSLGLIARMVSAKGPSSS
jgi:hypothetical protein